MKEYKYNTNDSGQDPVPTGAASIVDSSPDPSDQPAPTAAANPTTAGTEASSDTTDGAPANAGPLLAHDAIPPTPEISEPSCARKPIVKIIGIGEIGRASNTRFTFWKPPFEVESGFEGSIDEISQRAEWVHSPLFATPTPTGWARYGTTDELFVRLQEAIGAQAHLPAQTSALLAYWTISTWFSDGLSLVPGLIIVGPPHEGNLLLRTLRNFCHFPLLMTGVNIAELKKVNWATKPTLLIYDPNVTTQMATFLGCTTSRGYLIGDAGQYKDFFGPKAIYVGTEISAGQTPHCSLQVSLNTTTVAVSQKASRLGESCVQNLQNQLMCYRLKNLVKVYNSSFEASTLTSEMRAIANALGACIIDSPKLQSELISLLTPAANQQDADRSTGLEAVTLEAILNLCHQDKSQIFVAEIAAEANRITKARGERLSFSAEVIGHRMKKIGLFTRRLGSKGKGLVADAATITLAHKLATMYGIVGLGQDEKSLQCPQCIDNKIVV